MLKTVLRQEDDLAHSDVSTAKVATGRSAVKLLMDRYKPTDVLMPCYVPDGILDPVVMSGARVVFYKLLSTMTPALDDVERQLARCKTSTAIIVIAIDYFGGGLDMTALHQLCKRRGAILFADLAQCVPYTTDANCDVLLYSLNKFLPVVDGAFIKSKVWDVSVAVDEDRLPPMPVEAVNGYKAHLKLNAALEEEGNLRASQRAYDSYYSIIKDCALYGQSAESRRADRNAEYEQIRRRRVDLSSRLSGSLYHQFRVAGGWYYQFAYPILCQGKRDAVQEALLTVGIVAARQERRWNHIPRSGFSVESNFISDHLLLPINERVQVSDIDIMCDTINRFA